MKLSSQKLDGWGYRKVKTS